MMFHIAKWWAVHTVQYLHAVVRAPFCKNPNSLIKQNCSCDEGDDAVGALNMYK